MQAYHMTLFRGGSLQATGHCANGNAPGLQVCEGEIDQASFQLYASAWVLLPEESQV